MRLGIDIGRVIIGPTIDGQADTRFIGTTLAEALTTPPAPGAFQAIQRLVGLFDGAVWLVSKAGPSVQRKTIRWLDVQGFHAATGIGPERVRFCLQRHEKADHCRELGLTHFIDDRRDVLDHLTGVVDYRFLFGEQPAPPPRGMVHVEDWPAVLAWFERELLET